MRPSVMSPNQLGAATTADVFPPICLVTFRRRIPQDGKSIHQLYSAITLATDQLSEI